MKSLRNGTTIWLILLVSPTVADARLWTDSSGQYTLEANLIAFNNKKVVLQRADHDLVAFPIDQLSTQDREYLKSKDASDLASKQTDGLQTWTLRDGTKVVGRIVDFSLRDMTIQRRRGRIYVNDRWLQNLPEWYQQLLPKVVAHFEESARPDRRGLEAWLVRQRAEKRTFRLEGVTVEVENGDEYSLPFFLFSDEHLKLLKAGWDKWRAAHGGNDDDAQEDQAYLLRSLAAARHRDQAVQREIALMQLKLQAVQAGLTSLWEVTLFPAAGQGGPPLWVVVPGRDSRQATIVALEQNPGFVAGPVRRVAR